MRAAGYEAAELRGVDDETEKAAHEQRHAQQCPPDQHAGGTQEQAHGDHEEGGPDPETPQDARGQQQLRQETDDAGIEAPNSMIKSGLFFKLKSGKPQAANNEINTCTNRTAMKI